MLILSGTYDKKILRSNLPSFFNLRKEDFMTHAILCGTDAHSKTLVNRIAVDRGTPQTMKVANTDQGRSRLIRHLKSLAEKHEAERVVLAYEAGYEGFTLYDACVAMGVECYVLAPTKLRKSLKDKKFKADVPDAQMILEVLRGFILAGNQMPSIWVPDHQTRDDRELVRMRLNCAQKLTGLKAEIRALLKRSGIVKDPEAGDPWTQGYMSWLHHLELTPGAQLALDSLLRQINAIAEEIAILDKHIEELSQTERYKEAATVLVKKIKGVGLLTAMVFLTEMGDLSRFKNRRKVGSFLGFIPSSNDSGDANNRKGHITREGPGRLRWILSQASWSRIRWNEKEHGAYQRIVARNPGNKKKAAVACARRLGILMWHIGLEAQQKAGVFQVAE
jgi:transposase